MLLINLMMVTEAEWYLTGCRQSKAISGIGKMWRGAKLEGVTYLCFANIFGGISHTSSNLGISLACLTYSSYLEFHANLARCGTVTRDRGVGEEVFICWYICHWLMNQHCICQAFSRLSPVQRSHVSTRSDKGLTRPCGAHAMCSGC